MIKLLLVVLFCALIANVYGMLVIFAKHPLKRYPCQTLLWTVVVGGGHRYPFLIIPLTSMHVLKLKQC